MIDKFKELCFFIEIGVAVVWAIALWQLVRHYWKEDVEFKSDYLRVPINNTLVILGLIVPVLVALASYLYINNPKGSYSFLLAAIVLFFSVLIVAIWETFALLSIASKEEIVKIRKKNLNIIIGMSWMYGVLILGLRYFAIFFLIELKLPLSNAATELQTGNSVFDIKKNVNTGKMAEVGKDGNGSMNGARFLDKIRIAIDSGEKPGDVVTMINILAERKAKVNERDIKKEDYEYVAGMLCIVYPMKPPKYERNIRIFRKNFRGISDDINIQAKFKGTMTHDLLIKKRCQKL